MIWVALFAGTIMWLIQNYKDSSEPVMAFWIYLVSTLVFGSIMLFIAVKTNHSPYVVFSTYLDGGSGKLFLCFWAFLAAAISQFISNLRRSL
ncbi:hypothetical protein Misp06_03431 [Microbulbifer sp. NBRC 101763]